MIFPPARLYRAMFGGPRRPAPRLRDALLEGAALAAIWALLLVFFYGAMRAIS